LLALQAEDGSFEGEVVWCPMLAAQYVLLHHIVRQPLAPTRRRRVLCHFRRTRLESGLWSLRENGPPNLFVTTLVYVAARLLGVGRGDLLLEPARRFLQGEGVLAIPTWGKFWLALLNLYDWRGVNAILPEIWILPRWMPLHPSNWYCHTRLIYMGMAAIYALGYQAPLAPLLLSIREELYPQGFANADFAASRNRLREGDLYARPSIWVRAGFAVARLFDRMHNRGLRARCAETLLGGIRWELRTTNHTSISPVSGILNIIALWLRDPDDADGRRALKQLDLWIWEDDADGLRVSGARSASWDTAFALQALSAASGLEGVSAGLERGAAYLRKQQIGESFAGYRDVYRNDPLGGWCFAAGWHGWPVTDCTAEAVLGLFAADGEGADVDALANAVGFMLRGQNRDGGFGTYESQRCAVGLEWLNPAEMFGDSMTEHSYVECTASCLAALAALKSRCPQVIGQAESAAFSRAAAWLRGAQDSDGSWRGAWGVQYIYGTFFGIRGLLAAGARPNDPALRSACQWLLDRQREDGGWGERHGNCPADSYIAHEESQVTQSAWALIALQEAGEPCHTAIARGIRFLIEEQGADGAWPRQDMAGVFFRTALLDYVLYRQYFPVHALGVYEQWRASAEG
jgi:lanosterol synthase